MRRPSEVARRPEVEPQAAFPQYEERGPSSQNAVDLLPGWTCAFPPECRVIAGELPLYADDRLEWLFARYGPLEKRSVLEIGPLEGMHTYMLDQQNPASIDAVEANRLCYLRCLVASQILGLQSARFHLGDARRWLEHPDRSYDLIVASGVLYHMNDPAQFLELAASRCDALFLWTHYYSLSAMPFDDPRHWPFSGREVVSDVASVRVRGYERSYKEADRSASFCGGMSDRHYWLHRDDILALLKALGFASIEIGDERVDHSGGPCFSLLARRAT